MRLLSLSPGMLRTSKTLVVGSQHVGVVFTWKPTAGPRKIGIGAQVFFWLWGAGSGERARNESPEEVFRIESDTLQLPFLGRFESTEASQRMKMDDLRLK